ncbi:hypothetical protein ANCCEY_07406 [Ancylostoma ceylanicum]|uniref:Uncharacterized protein n=1 Tax=Ancylostoma ceylanicum TaxID=53326 RepID=A0A0D6LU09_9BILA|nr:hypothetical protein ANCCEY_07406 [Ancylostoma ceylanicum]
MMATCILLLAYTTSRHVAQVVYTAAIVSSGINVVGSVKCAPLVARQHAHFVMSVISFLLCVIILLVPVAVNIVCPDNTPEQVYSVTEKTDQAKMEDLRHDTAQQSQ